MDATNPEKFYIYITDPMLATGNSLLAAIELYASKGIPIDNIKCICIIAAPEGIKNIQKQRIEIEVNQLLEIYSYKTIFENGLQNQNRQKT